MSSFKVELAIYDLSHGMAATLSGQLLGPDHAISMVPHTGVVAYGREYFFSAGIQNLCPNQFRSSRNIQPTQILTIGNTSKTRAEFENWCNSRETRKLYNETSYDLFTRNCNNFSDYALKSGFNLGSGVPDWILEVPGKVASSPMGQMLMPMLNGMQAPFSPNTNNIQVPTTTQMPSTQTKPLNNPWAHIPPTSEPKENSTTFSPPQKKIKNEKKKPTPILDSYSNLFLSDDKSTISLCIKKLHSSENTQRLDRSFFFEELEKELTCPKPQLKAEIIEKTLYSFIDFPSGYKSDQPELKTKDTTLTLMALMLLRLVVLNPLVLKMSSTSKKDDQKSDNVNGNSSPQYRTNTDIIANCIHKISSHLLHNHNENSHNPYLTHIPLRCMAWCTLSNALVNPSQYTQSLDLKYLLEQDSLVGSNNNSITNLVERAIGDISSDRKEIRQAASAFLCNLIHVISTQSKYRSKKTQNLSELSEWIVTVLVGSLDNLDSELDDTTKLRRLLIVAKILHLYGRAASQLVKDLGFGETLKDIRLKYGKNGNDIHKLIDEIILVLYDSC